MKFNLGTELTNKASTIFNNVGKALVKKMLMLGSREINKINNSNIYDTYKDIYLSEKKGEEKLLHGIQSTNDLKACASAKKADDTAIIVSTKENAVKKTFVERFTITLYFDFFKHPVYSYGLKEDLIVSIELNSSEKEILCNEDITETYKLS